MKRRTLLNACIVATVGLSMAGQAMATDIVNDTWQDGTRDDPAAPVYSEMGVDSDLDGDIESAWFRGGTGTFDPVGPGGPLRLDNGGSTSSSSLTTYFTPETQEITLANVGDWMRVTWQFQVSGQNDSNTSHGMRIAVADSPGFDDLVDSRVTTDASPGANQYTGYAVFFNIYDPLTRSDPFELYERANPAGFENFLSSSSAWSALADDGSEGNTGYLPGVDYTFTMKLTHQAGGLRIQTSIAGAGLDNDGLMSIDYLDATPDSYSFDTFQFRPDGVDRAFEIYDTSLFKVEYVPEPGSIALLLTGMGVLFATRRTRKA